MDPNRLENYDYHLPENLIAQTPAEPRDSSRLLVLHRGKGTWEHRSFVNLPSYLDSQDLLIANNTRVMKARLLGNRVLEQGNVGGKIEFLLLRELRSRVWEGAFHAAAKHKPGVMFRIPTPDGQGLHGTLIQGASESPHGTVVAEFDRDPKESGAGEVPLPHYIERAPTLADEQRDYQTIFAKHLGSAAAPTAGFHFTDRVMAELRGKGVGWAEVTLHVGLGTFRPVKLQDIRQHLMHEEQYEISEQTADQVNIARSQSRRIVAVGTTSVRTLESAWKDGRLQKGLGRTGIFIYPGGHQFQVVDRLLTNFHLPKSTLLMLISAFAGREFVMEAYTEAVREKYRFFSYGDAMLIL